jgi:hypothetical protein
MKRVKVGRTKHKLNDDVYNILRRDGAKATLDLETI